MEILPTMRSRSPTCSNASRIVSRASGCRNRCSTTVCRLRMGRTSLSGKASHRCSIRPPIGVIVRSIMSKSVLLSAVCPPTNSKFRIVKRSSQTYLSSSIRLRCWMCPVCRCCVMSRYISIPPAAVTPAGIFSRPKPFNELTPQSFCNRSRAVDSTNCQSSNSNVKYLLPKRFSTSLLRPRRNSTSFGAKLVSNLSI